MEFQSLDPECAKCKLPDYVFKKGVPVRAVMGVVCSLSIIGSLLIILSYVLFKNLRTRARYFLVHLSITDLVLAVSNLVGVVANLDNVTNNHSNSSMEITDSYYCRVQGFLTLYSTLSSFLWTVQLAFLVFILVTAGNPKRITKFLMWFCYLLCYGLPLLPSVWALVTRRTGYAPLSSVGWCTLKSQQVYYYGPEHSQNEVYCAKVDIYANVIAYNMWIVVSFGVILLAYLSVHCHINNKDKMIALKTDKHAEDYWEVMNNIDYKFALIPVAFILIRIWSLVSDIVYIYAGLSPDKHHLPKGVVYFLMCSMGIGNSAQGFVDAIIFVVFTHQVRKNMIVCFCRWLRPKRTTLNINSETKSPEDSYRPRRYHPEQYIVHSAGIDEKLAPTTSATSYVSNYNDEDYSDSEDEDNDLIIN